ncbi:helix-turn-helix transcriptional regulator [Bacillus cereus]|uniref:helix-turn-helix domain-containing protein n=1 Tax=Bacillus TaxID=1386 RepID=UPI0001A1253F|nr:MULTISPECIES: helix-turn-helix transcriptional regulator [Bacillus]EEL73397.1 Prophage LambdaBa02, repressor protein [Bacillus cereus AH676]KIQ83566.1 XRE family transcriptional regulator [Bacillus sp. L_1B0_5]KIQ91657.1 XRE family transcriptional regulator [Bacillus sp. L_1B0_8]HDR4450928.1 helix-turn-helix transcriptional regulator [Bacillus cereus]
MRGDRVKQLRKSKGWTQGELGDAVGLKKATISLIENNKRDRSERSVSVFAEVLGCTSDYLLGFSDDPQLNGEQHSRLKQEFNEIYEMLQKMPEAEQEMYLKWIKAGLNTESK